ncbi:hypothetical protein G6L37_22775 [Agrobacterium rubi]|uniref:hypothetical protein n=1 Tax=Agrobacterium rubi TaxID=28099 RepID=UPI0015742DC4|nr:hypothetical protein [Agrobacterium rubi]NTF08953.1 hypothetical protein [Agrobacterium rubi]NTF21224.1 hypothetical protein [Agrobacterium rubi]NTF28081.1 hypothetical protein [Agrobacterium rubi]
MHLLGIGPHDKALPNAELVTSCANMVDFALMFEGTNLRQGNGSDDMVSEQVSPDHVTMFHTPKTSKAKPTVVPVSEADVVPHLSETGHYRILKTLTLRAVMSFSRPDFSFNSALD